MGGAQPEHGLFYLSGTPVGTRRHDTERPDVLPNHDVPR